ncbi:MAG: sigma-54 dependent transcriptional regulator [Myxococcales bacterium]
MSGEGEQAAGVEVAIVEDEKNLRELYQDLLRGRGYAVTAFDRIAPAEAALSTRAPDLLLLDVKLPDGDGLLLLERLRKTGVQLPVVVITAFGTVEHAVKALRAGATDFLVKPVDNRLLLATVERALAAGRELVEVELSAATLSASAATEELVGASGGLREVVSVLPQIAASTATVLIHGETGTGKEVIAKAIHAASPRRDGPFVSLNCAALPPSLLESELFGFERGAFTGAHQRHKGLIEAADGGTLFLDEIGDMPLEAQAKLLRVLQEREITRVGGREVVKVDLRIIAATHRDLAAWAAQGKFREDLRFRLAVLLVELPPLRQRTQDIPGLIEHFLEKHAQRQGRGAPRPDAELLERAKRYGWPGNVRELENMVERAVALGAFDPCSVPAVLAHAALPPAPSQTAGGGSALLDSALVGAHGTAPVRSLRDAVAVAERAAVIAALEAAKGNKAEAARMLGVSYKTLFNKIHEHQIREETHIG